MNNNSILTEQIRNTLSVSYDDITDFSINHNFNLWLQNKEYLMSILSKSPDWDESRLCVHKKISYNVQGNDYAPLQDLLKGYLKKQTGYRNAVGVAEMVIRGEKQGDGVMAVMCMLFVIDNNSIVNNGMFTAPLYDGDIEDFSGVSQTSHPIFGAWLANFFHIKKEIKLTRLARKIIDIIIKDWYNIPDKWIEDIMDSLVCKTYTTSLVISIHPCDYLTQSHGRNWTSCHTLRDQGCYHAGILNMMVDNTSVIVYTLKLEDYYNALEKNLLFYDIEKVKRASVFKNDEAIMVNPLYPDCQNNGVKNNPLFDVIKKEVFDIFGCKEWYEIDKDDIRINYTQYFGYDDWSSKSVTVKSCVDSPKLIIGRDAISVDGRDEFDIIDNTETMELDRDKTFCECCGERFNDDDMYYIENYGWVYENCFHDGYFYYCEGSEAYYYENRDESIIVDNCTYNRDWAFNNLDIRTDYYRV